MNPPEQSDKTTSFLFYVFIIQIALGILAVVGYMIYSIFN